MKHTAALIAASFALLALAAVSPARADTKELKTGAFQVQQELVLPAAPEAV